MEEISIRAESKQEMYEQLLPQIQSLVDDEPNVIANMANIVAALKQTFQYYSWIGFYLYDAANDSLVLGPFQGKIACTRIAVGKGVCGTSFASKKTIIVPDVNKFPGHIFCDGDSKSEIVIPLINDGKIHGVLDIDSHHFDSFNETDQKYLEQMIQQLAGKIIHQ